MALSEEELQEGVATVLRYRRLDCVWFHVPNGGHRHVATAARLKRMGVLPGVADLVFFGNMENPIAFIELKKKNGRQTPAQKAFEIECAQRSVPYFVIKSDDQNEMNAKVLGTLKALGIVS